MKFAKSFSRIAVCVGSLLLPAAFFAQDATPCQPPEITAAVYNFVPDAQLQSGDFRPLMKTESSFLDTLQRSANVSVTDLTTPILSSDIMPDPPRISGDLQPPPDQFHDTYFFTGQITKMSTGFLLSVQLKRSSDGSLLDEIKTPFSDASGAEAAGAANAAIMVSFFASQAQTARDNRETGDHAIDPHIDLIIDKLQLKPNETSPVKIVLSDCDGVRLKHRAIEAFLQLSHGGSPIEESTLVRATDDKGERNGDIGAHAPGVITYIAKFKYKDVMGVPRERTDTKTVVISGGEADTWQMRADILEERSTVRTSVDQRSGRFSGERYYVSKKSSMVFVFKAKMDASGGLATDEYKDYNGYGTIMFRRKNITTGDEAEVIEASGLLDQSQAATELLHAGFSIGPAGSEFQASVQNVKFKGTEELFAVRRQPYNYVRKTGLEYTEESGGDGGATITPQMVKNGVYVFSTTNKTLIDDPENSALRKGETKGYEIKKIDFEVRRIGPGGAGIIKR